MNNFIMAVNSIAFECNKVFLAGTNIPNFGQPQELPADLVKDGGVLDITGKLITLICGILASVSLALAVGIIAWAGIKVLLNHGKKDQVWNELGQTSKAVMLGCAITCGAMLIGMAIGAILTKVGLSKV